jgi:glycosyltransferase involved in cell wall biosynthesis
MRPAPLVAPRPPEGESTTRTEENREEPAGLLQPVPLPALEGHPLVSILMANYNYGRFLGEAIESVLAQTYPHFELIVCDDGSTDHSADVVERYRRRDPRIHLTRQANGGTAAAHNAAYRRSRGRILCLLDADDRYLPEKLEKVVEGFRFRADCGFLGHPVFRTDEAWNRLGVSPWLIPPPDGWYAPYLLSHGDLYLPGLAFGSAISLRREIAERIFPMPERFTRCSDGVIMVLAPLLTKLAGIPLPLNEYRCHGSNDMNTRQVTPESLDRERELGKAFWQLRKNYLDAIDPRLARRLPEMDTACSDYTRARLVKSRHAYRAYWTLLQSGKLRPLSRWSRWFLRVSILLPLPLFRFGVNLASRPNRLRHWLWRLSPGAARRGPIQN